MIEILLTPAAPIAASVVAAGAGVALFGFGRSVDESVADVAALMPKVDNETETP